MTITSQLNLGRVPSTNPKGFRVFSFTGTESTVKTSHKILTISCYKTTQTQRQAEKNNSNPEPHSAQKVEPAFYIHDFDYLKQRSPKSGACGRLGCPGQRVIPHHIPEGPWECCEHLQTRRRLSNWMPACGRPYIQYSRHSQNEMQDGSHSLRENFQIIKFGIKHSLSIVNSYSFMYWSIRQKGLYQYPMSRTLECCPGFWVVVLWHHFNLHLGMCEGNIHSVLV